MNRVLTMAKKLKAFFLVLAAGAGWVFLNSTAPAETVLISTNAFWKYLDTGGDQGVALWRAANYDDSGWSGNLAPLGYGVTPEGEPVVTAVGYGPNPTNKYVTTYFRQVFVVSNLTAISNLTLTLQSLEGGVVYLNYFEAYRNLMPA